MNEAELAQTILYLVISHLEKSKEINRYLQT